MPCSQTRRPDSDTQPSFDRAAPLASPRVQAGPRGHRARHAPAVPAAESGRSRHPRTRHRANSLNAHAAVGHDPPSRADHACRPCPRVCAGTRRPRRPASGACSVRPALAGLTTTPRARACSEHGQRLGPTGSSALRLQVRAPFTGAANACTSMPRSGPCADCPRWRCTSPAGGCGRQAAFSRMCTPQAEPRPITCARPSRAPSI